jgi:ABC-2 type transport system ATP-binding protein
MADPPPPLLAEGLTKDYGRFRALDGLDLTVQPGEVIGLLGPNGSGKSTALRLFLGFLRPTAGRAELGGFDCWSAGVEARRRVAYLPAELRLYEDLTGRELLRFLGRLRGREPDPTEVAGLAGRLDVDLSRPLRHLSSGMKRKAALMSVLLPEVPLVLLDEPTNALDPTMRSELISQLRRLRDRGQAVVFSSHVLPEVEAVCDRVVVLRKGRLVHAAAMSDLRQVRSVRVRFPRVPERWPEALGVAPAPAGADGTVCFSYRGELPPLLSWLAAQGVTDLSVEAGGLTAVYQQFHGVAP